MYEVQRSDESWKNAWSQQKRGKDQFMYWCSDVVQKLPLNNIQNACIFNCSDGPAALGITLALTRYNESVSVVLTDIHGYPVQASKQYITDAIKCGLIPSSVTLDAQVQDTRVLLTASHEYPKLFIAFEPVSVDILLFESAYEKLLPNSSIVVIGRGRLGPVSQLGVAGKHKGATLFVESGVWTEQGEITAIMLSK